MSIKDMLRKYLGVDQCITSVNGVKPDSDGNVNVSCLCNDKDEEHVSWEDLEYLLTVSDEKDNK